MAARMTWRQRAAARIARMTGLRVYQTAQDTRFRQSAGMAGGSSANGEVTAGAQRAAWNARDAVRNDAFARRMVDIWAANAVGTGVTCAWDDAARDAAWRRWAATTACDAEGKKTLAAIEALVMRAVVTDGEAIVRLIPGPPTERNPVGLTLQVLEADHLDRLKTGIFDGAAVMQGVEIDPERGRPVAYWLLPRHPGETWPLLPSLSQSPSVRVPAEFVLHVYRQERPGQVRGISWLTPVLPVLRDLSDYEAALLMKAKIEACMSAIVTDNGEETLTPAEGRVTDAAGNVIETFEPGMIIYRKGAGEIEVVNPSGGGSHLQFARRALERAAVGGGLTYDQVSGDLTGANYSSLRAGKIEFRALNGQVQWTILLPQLCAPVAEAFDRAGAMAGLWRVGGGFTHTPEAPEVVDPLKDITAIIMQIRAGLLSPQDAAAMLGWSYAEVIAKIAEADAMRDAAGVVVDSDPRRLAKSGTAHDAAQVAAVEIAATGAAMPQAPQPTEPAPAE
jgi:lambda family phage portal protein